jgi:radical SAM protein (TIGR01212 family)
MTQRESNPFVYSDSNKRYHTYSYYLKQAFGGKCAKLPIDAGLTCPNIDGRCGSGGCIYCSGRGSGDFALSSAESVSEQIRAQKKMLSAKWDTSRCIAYFQAHSNTYAPLAVLKPLYEAALAEEGIVGISIATRADCLEDDVVSYLAELAQKTTLTVELGLQSVHDRTAAYINRGHCFADFCEGYQKLRRASDRIRIGVHLILGLPHESDADMMESVRAVAALAPDEVKLHLLHILKGTRLAALYESGEYIPLERDRYVRLVADALELLPPTTVIGRLTGDGKAEDLIAPRWSRDKKSVINEIDKLLYARNSYQGRMRK